MAKHTLTLLSRSSSAVSSALVGVDAPHYVPVDDAAAVMLRLTALIQPAAALACDRFTPVNPSSRMPRVGRSATTKWSNAWPAS